MLQQVFYVNTKPPLYTNKPSFKPRLTETVTPTELYGANCTTKHETRIYVQQSSLYGTHCSTWCTHRVLSDN